MDLLWLYRDMLNSSWYIMIVIDRRFVGCPEGIRVVVRFVVILSILVKAIISIAHLMACNVGFIASLITEGCLGMIIVIVESIVAIGVYFKRAIWCPVNACDFLILVIEVSLVEVGWEVFV